jgi:hypothetical protein
MSKAVFKIKGKEYEFKEISLRTYYSLQDLLISPEKGVEYKIVECLTTCPVDILMQLKYADWLIVWEEAQIQIGKLSGSTASINPIVEYNGVKYGLPNIDDMTVGEFVDLDLVLTGANAERKLEEIAAIVYRPVISQKGNQLELAPYNTEGFRERKEIFLDFPISAIKSANSFFLQYANLSLKNTVASLVNLPEMDQMPEKDQETLRSLAQVDLGGDLSIPWLEKILFDFQKLRIYNSAPLLTGLPGKKTRLINKLWPFKQNNQKSDAN